MCILARLPLIFAHILALTNACCFESLSIFFIAVHSLMIIFSFFSFFPFPCSTRGVKIFEIDLFSRPTSLGDDFNLPQSNSIFVSRALVKSMLRDTTDISCALILIKIASSYYVTPLSRSVALL